MRAWPPLSKVMIIWAVLTASAYALYVWHFEQAPPDELVMADSFSFKALVGLVVVGLPSVLFLFLFLVIGAISKTYLLEATEIAPGEQQQEDMKNGAS